MSCASSTATSAISTLWVARSGGRGERQEPDHLTMDVDEAPIFRARIDFQGNNTTRDKVIRREMLMMKAICTASSSGKPAFCG